MEKLSLSQKEWQILIGGLLGDSYFNKKKNLVRFSHSDKQFEYLSWKYENLNQDYTRGMYPRIYKEGYKNHSFDFVNKGNALLNEFNFIKKHLYSNDGRKKISIKILNELNPIGLAVWWMDDGYLCTHKGNRYGRLCTESFNYEEHILIQKYFKEKWDIDVGIRSEENKYYFIRFNVKALKKLIRIIYKYVAEVPSMIYKIDLNYVNQRCIGDFSDVYFYIKEHKSNILPEAL